MASHRRPSSRRRVPRGWRRTIVHGARAGMLLAAMLTTCMVGVAAIDPGEGALSGAQADDRDDRDDTASPPLFRGLAALHTRVRRALDAADADRRPARAEIPARSGSGRRVVFDMSAQRVWIVGPDGQARSTYPVSGSRSDNLKPGRYRVFSRSRWAVGFDRHSTMQYFVRFAHGKNSTIGFHDIPVDHSGRRVQSYAALGTPRSAGCIRQHRPDAKRMWRFAAIDTRVVVVA
ncbi:L,D-transpeptidase [Solicola gregarius]|uniref:L,D-transpeptidase n=1 Tax=Solicola gregarius TaxID=2908642 RepID=A0AA46TKK6_9ACTN|nr:L,D-transpeptidase [Solicola gregarius]UYM06143.1 L,D-transpeptidase [Solicola gregarius]